MSGFILSCWHTTGPLREAHSWQPTGSSRLQLGADQLQNPDVLSFSITKLMTARLGVKFLHQLCPPRLLSFFFHHDFLNSVCREIKIFG